MRKNIRSASIYLGIFVVAIVAQLFFAKSAHAAVPQVYFLLSTSTLQENSSISPAYASYYVTIKLSAASATTVQVKFSRSGTASFGSSPTANDYPTLATDVVTFSAGQTTKYVQLDPWDNSILELNKTVILTLHSPVNATLGAQTTHTHTLVDNDVKFQFLTDVASGSESTSGYTRVMLANGGVAPDNIAVDVTVSSVAGSPGVAYPTSDFYLSLPGTFYPVYFPATPIAAQRVTATILAGANSAQVNLGVVNDSDAESDEYFQLALSNPSAGTISSPTTFTYTITDNDTAPPPPGLPSVVQFSMLASSGDESVSGPSLVVSMPMASASTVSVNYKMGAEGTATVADFNFTAGTLIIPAGSLSASVPLTIIDDSLVEANETVVIALENPVNATLGANSQHTYTISDNDTVPPPPVPPADPGAPPTPPADPGSPPGGGGGPSVPSSVCPTLNVGDMVKVSGKPAIYAVNKFLKIMYFPSGDEFKSWNQTESYGGYITINEECFDSLPTPIAFPGGVNFRPGSYVIKKSNNSQLYVVLPNNAVAKISSADATALYGVGYKVMSVSSVFWPNYISVGSDVSAKAHAGMLVRKDGKVWYVDGLNLREVSAAGMAANRFKDAFIRTVPSSYLTGLGVGITVGLEVPELMNRTQL